MYFTGFRSFDCFLFLSARLRDFEAIDSCWFRLGSPPSFALSDNGEGESDGTILERMDPVGLDPLLNEFARGEADFVGLGEAVLSIEESIISGEFL